MACLDQGHDDAGAMSIERSPEIHMANAKTNFSSSRAATAVAIPGQLERIDALIERSDSPKDRNPIVEMMDTCVNDNRSRIDAIIILKPDGVVIQKDSGVKVKAVNDTDLNAEGFHQHLGFTCIPYTKHLHSTNDTHRGARRDDPAVFGSLENFRFRQNDDADSTKRHIIALVPIDARGERLLAFLVYKLDGDINEYAFGHFVTKCTKGVRNLLNLDPGTGGPRQGSA